MQPSTLIRNTLAALVIAVSSTHAAEMRIWMSRKGGTLEAEHGSTTGGELVLIKPDGKEVKLKVEDLSLADRQHLVEYGGADKAIIAGGESGFPEKDVLIDSNTLKKRNYSGL
ncbi:MAG: y domain 1 [Verrucomicrobiota bacterium]